MELKIQRIPQSNCVFIFHVHEYPLMKYDTLTSDVLII